MHESFDSGLPVWRHSRNQLLPSSMLTSVLTNSLQGRLETGFQHTPFTEGQAVGGDLGTASSGLQPRTGTHSGSSYPDLGRRGEGPGLADSPGRCPPSTFVALQVLLEHWPQWRDAGELSRAQLSPEGPGIVLHELMHVLGF